MTARAIKAWGKWFTGEYQVDDPYAALAFVRQPDPLPQRTVRLDRDAQRALRRYAPALDAWELATDREPVRARLGFDESTV